jgi:hypothetical protein
MKFKDLNPTIIELAAPYIFHRIQLVRSRTTSVQMNGVAMPPVGLMYGRYCLPDEPVAYLADSPETALYETLLRRETVSRSLSELRRRGRAGVTVALQQPSLSVKIGPSNHVNTLI